MLSFSQFLFESFDLNPEGGLRSHKIRHSTDPYEETHYYHLGANTKLVISHDYIDGSSIALSHGNPYGEKAYDDVQVGHFAKTIHRKAVVALKYHMKNYAQFDRVSFTAANRRMAPVFAAILHGVLNAHARYSAFYQSPFDDHAVEIGGAKTHPRKVFAKTLALLAKTKKINDDPYYTPNFEFHKIKE